MSWKELLSKTKQEVLPWFGLSTIHNAYRSWTLVGDSPLEHGWYKFDVTAGRAATLASPEPQPGNLEWADGQQKIKGYVVGGRFIPDGRRVITDPSKLVQQTQPLYCIEPGLERFARATAVLDRHTYLVFMQQEFPEAADEEVTIAYRERRSSLKGIKGVTPALDLAFRWMTHQRNVVEERRRQLELLREEEEKKIAEAERYQKLLKESGSAVGRRAIAEQDFETAAREALNISGATLLDARPSKNRGEMVVQYRFDHRGLECVVDAKTLRVIDAGICLTDEYTGEKGDARFTLESLPGVVREAIRAGSLVVWRHAD